MPQDKLLRIEDIIGQRPITEAEAEVNRRRGKRGRYPRPGIEGRIPMSKATWFAGIRSGRFPAPDVRDLGRNYWKESSIDALLERMANSPDARTRSAPPAPGKQEGA